MALVGAICALGLTVLAGVCAANPRSLGHTGARGFPIASGSPRKSAVSAGLPGRHERLVGIHEASAQSRLELPRPSRQPLPPHKRVDPRPELALRPEVRLPSSTRALLSFVLPECHGRIADRPVVANCPAQGPPRTA